MKDTLLKQISELNQKYGRIGVWAIQNMRLLLLVLFAGLSAFLVLRINRLVNSDGVTNAADETSALSKKVDSGVVSKFDELYIQQVQVDSNFVSDRDNPF